jgi:hypothetical protein
MAKITNEISTNFAMRDKTLSFFGKTQYNDWRVILAVFFLGFIGAAIFGLYLLYNIGGSAFDGELTVVSGKKIKKELLTEMISKMEERQMKFNELKINKPGVGDPSL